MKLTFAALIATSLSVLTGQVLAQCPSNLSGEQMIECITVENAGYFYPSQTDTDANQVSTTSSNTNDPNASSTITAMGVTQ